MNHLHKRIELLANVSIIIVAALLSTVLVRNYILSGPPTKQANQSSVGTKLNLSDVDWAKNSKTLLLALSSTCYYCTESAPFYRQLVQKKGNVRLIAVLPQAVDSGRKYLDTLGVAVDEIQQASFSSIGVVGTPTLILVDNAGVVTNEWVGALTTDKETEILNQLQTELSTK
ncbi:MAG: redoxin family protein [Acidobacteriota bacterium]|nr:redoxin family protein [Acidobacteriota bacterium]